MGLQPPRATDLSRTASDPARRSRSGSRRSCSSSTRSPGAQINASTAVQERVGPVDGTVERELHACQLELITEVCASAGEAIDALDGLRRAVVETGAGLLGAGTHPSAAEGDAEITDKERYERIRYLLGDAVATPVGGLHIHVGMPDAEDGDPRLQRAALPSAAPAGAGSELAVPPRPRHRPGLGARGDAARVAALGRAARHARLRGLLRHRGASGARRGRAGLHVVLVEAAPAPASGDRRDPRARRAGLARGHRGAGRAHALPGPPRGRGGARPASSARGARGGHVPGGALRRRGRAARSRRSSAARVPSCWTPRSTTPAATPTSCGARQRSRSSRHCCVAAAEPGASVPHTRSAAWGRCCASSQSSPAAGTAARAAHREPA